MVVRVIPCSRQGGTTELAWVHKAQPLLWLFAAADTALQHSASQCRPGMWSGGVLEFIARRAGSSLGFSLPGTDTKMLSEPVAGMAVWQAVGVGERRARGSSAWLHSLQHIRMALLQQWHAPMHAPPTLVLLCGVL